MGDEIENLINDKSLLLINHQSTSDVPLIMAALDGHKGACRNIMWIMDKMFLRTNFGIVSWFHKDFFISSVSELKFFHCSISIHLIAIESNLNIGYRKILNIFFIMKLTNKTEIHAHA